ncbi:hypothetical protein AB0B85_13630 [Micromonospora sp. NPDC049044]|uniref:hypothetical protein n=1 Tax=unclassified Micromonospora TaxID=2617518 RepID=UPI0033FB016A
MTQPQRPIDPWTAASSTEQLPTTPSTTPFPSVPPQATPPPAPPFPAQAAPQFSAPPAPQFSGPPAQHSALPGGAWPAAGPYPPSPVSAHPAPLAFGGPEVVAVQIGEIAVCPPVIRTPAGVLPLAGASWHVTDYWQSEEKVATWALVCAIVGFFCLTLFSLLFLLIKETRHHGTVQVMVTNGHQQYVARIPVSDQGQVQHINNQVNYARSLSGR